MVTHADELGIRKDQIFFGGESAGGGLCAALCMLARDRGEVNIAFQMPLYPMIDDMDTDSSRDNHNLVWNTRLREPFYCETLSFVENLRAPGVEVGLCALVYDDENGDWICPSLQGFTDYTENS